MHTHLSEGSIPWRRATLSFLHRTLKRTLCLAVLLAIIFSARELSIVLAERQSITRSQDIQLYVGDSLVISSDQNSIQRVFLQGNLTSASIMKPAQYPASRFELAAFNPGVYDLRVLFDLQTDYSVNLYAQPANQTRRTNSTSYYLFSGPSQLDIKASFVARPNIRPVVVASDSPSTSFANWIDKFGEAFPIWVKLLYLLLGIQFFAVGGLWIRRETARRESSPIGGSHRNNRRQV